jgi:outer membrane immunogenic protein
MRKVLGLVGATLLFAGPALAADLAVKAPRAATLMPVFSWTGCYIGGNAGGVWGHSNTTETLGGAWLATTPAADIAAIQANGSQSISTSGFTGGGQIGCNFQTGPLVLGLEADGEYTGLSGSTFSSVIVPVAGTQVNNVASLSSHSLFTVRPRVGFATGPWLFYATGGLAVGHVSFSDTQTYLATLSSASGSVSKTKSGWAVGGGVEYAIDNHWIAGVEYLHVDLGSVGFNTAVTPPFTAFTNAFSADLKEDIVRARLSYKF